MVMTELLRVVLLVGWVPLVERLTGGERLLEGVNGRVPDRFDGVNED